MSWMRRFRSIFSAEILDEPEKVVKEERQVIERNAKEVLLLGIAKWILADLQSEQVRIMETEGV